MLVDQIAAGGVGVAVEVAGDRVELTMVLERSPTLREIGDRLEMTEEQVAEALEAIDSRCQWSLDEPIDANGRTTLGALLPAPSAEIQLEDRLALPKLLDGLPELERRAVILRYYGDFKQHEIGAMLGYSQMHVSRLLRRALSQMRTQLAS
jgi:RNA polymerase sigma-B factor